MRSFIDDWDLAPSALEKFRCKMEKLQGTRDLVRFLNLLEDRGIPSFLGHHRDDSVMVTLTMSDVRIEVDFFERHIEYSLFAGAENPQHDQRMLFGLIAD